jgi:hypothetical protein
MCKSRVTKETKERLLELVQAYNEFSKAFGTNSLKKIISNNKNNSFQFSVHLRAEFKSQYPIT